MISFFNDYKKRSLCGPNIVENIYRCHQGLFRLTVQFLELFGRKLAELWAVSHLITGAKLG